MRRTWWLVALVVGCAPPPKVAPRVGDLYRGPNGRCQVRVAWPSAWAPVPCHADGPCEDTGVPVDIDCPEELLDPHEVSDAPVRPMGRERWLRLKPVLVLMADQMCNYEPDRFCAPPSQPFACEPARRSIAVECAALDGSPLMKPTRWSVESFRYTDAAGRCRVTRSRDCTQAACEHLEGELTECL